MNKYLIMALIILILSACGGAGNEEGLSRKWQNFIRNTVDHISAIFKGESTKREAQQNDREQAKLTHNSKNTLAVQKHLSQVVINMQSVPQIYDQKTEKEELEQYRKNYAQAVDLGDKVDALITLVQADQINAISLLKEAYASREPELRKEALLQMQNFKDKNEVVDMFLKALDDPDPDVVIEAVEGLSGIKSKRVIAGLKKIAKSHPDQLIREVAQDYLDQAEDKG